MPRLRKKWKRKHKTKFTKSYLFTKQDELLIEKIKTLQNVHFLIAKEIFKNMEYSKFKEFTINLNGLVVFNDKEYGIQAELMGTSKMPIIKRLVIHIGLLKMLQQRCCILKAIKTCLSMLTTQ